MNMFIPSLTTCCLTYHYHKHLCRKLLRITVTSLWHRVTSMWHRVTSCDIVWHAAWSHAWYGTSGTSISTLLDRPLYNVSAVQLEIIDRLLSRCSVHFELKSTLTHGRPRWLSSESNIVLDWCKWPSSLTQNRKLSMIEDRPLWTWLHSESESL